MKRFRPNWESIKSHELPEWYDASKLGIFIHWGLYSVPAFGTPIGELGTIPEERWYTNNPYAEWYYNSINVKQGPAYEHHIKTYGEDFKYEEFAKMWKAENWNPDEWADLFQKAGAKYVVITTKHHDGFCLFPSKYTDFSSVNQGPMRDIVGELAEAVRKKGMRFGVYYSGIIDWQYMNEPIFTDDDCRKLNSPTYAYADYVFNQYKELIDTYHPDVLWNDIGWPYVGEHMLPHLFAHFYNTCPEGVVNDRYNNLWQDFWVKEYEQGSMHRDEKWENIRGLGLSFGYNAMEGPEHTLSAERLTALLCNTVGNYGNLLINVGPKADGTIPKLQEESLRGMGKWLEVNGEAIFGTSPDIREPKRTKEYEVYFTCKEDIHYVLIDRTTKGEVELSDLEGEYELLDKDRTEILKETSNGLIVVFEEDNQYPLVLKKK